MEGNECYLGRPLGAPHVNMSKTRPGTVFGAPFRASHKAVKEETVADRLIVALGAFVRSQDSINAVEAGRT